MDNNRAKKFNMFRNTKRKKVKDLIKELSEREVSHQKLHIEELLKQRKKKLSEIRQLKNREISQPSLQPTRMLYHQFSSMAPVSSGQRFLPQKIRMSLISPDKAFSKAINMKSGSIKLVPKESPFLDKEVINKKFAQYDRITNEQSGTYKKKALEDRKLDEIKYHSLSVKQTKDSQLTLKAKTKISKMGMKKTFFQKYEPDKYRFYPMHLSSLNEEVFGLTALKKSSVQQRPDLLNSVNKSRTIDVSEVSQRQAHRGSAEKLSYLYSDRM